MQAGCHGAVLQGFCGDQGCTAASLKIVVSPVRFHSPSPNPESNAIALTALMICGASARTRLL